MIARLVPWLAQISSARSWAETYSSIDSSPGTASIASRGQQGWAGAISTPAAVRRV